MWFKTNGPLCESKYPISDADSCRGRSYGIVQFVPNMLNKERKPVRLYNFHLPSAS